MKRLLLLILIILIPSALFALTAPQIYFASDDALRNMVAMRNLAEGTREEMQAALYDFEGLDAYTINNDTENPESTDGGFLLTINGSENLAREEGRVVLTGNSSISMTDNGVLSELSADTIIIDMDNSRLTALENVNYSTDDESASIQDIEADIVTVTWDSGALMVTNATTETVSGEEGSADAITIYTSGETLSYSPDKGMLYNDGFITSNKEEAYVSITADEIALLSGADMFVTDAYLSIGRVPILWLPFFFFPGSQITGNPSMGFSSERGAFLNTTFELLGQAESVNSAGSDDEEPSFMSILSSGGNSENNQPTGAYYSSDRELSKAEQWARDTGSYVALMADAYAKNGIHMGVDSHISLFDDSLTLSVLDGVALSPESSYYDGHFRYYGVNEIDYSGYGFDVTLSLPFYSDSRVMMNFGDRLTGFSLFSLIQTPEFPTEYDSTITTFSNELEIDYRLPSELRNDYVASFSLSDFNVGVDYRWDTREHRYYVDDTTLPSFSASISGTIFDYATSIASPAVTVEKPKTDVTDIHLLSDPLLYAVYEAEAQAAENTGDETYSISLGYSFSENFRNEYGFDSSGEYDEGNLSSSSSMRLVLDAKASEYAVLSAVFTPTYSYLWEDSNSVTAYTHRGAVTSDITFSVPYIGIEYHIASRLFNYKSEVENGTEIDSDFLIPGWNQDTITSHSIALRKTFASEYGTFTPSIEYVLPPLAAELIPRMSYSYGPFALSFGWQFLQEETDTPFRSDLVELSLGYNGTYITSNISLRYQSADYDPDAFWNPFYGNASLSLRTEDRKWSITQYFDYFAYEHGEYNYFDSIKTTLQIPYFDISVEWQGVAGEVDFKGIQAHLDVDSAFFQLWKGRLYFAFGLDSEFEFNMDNPYASMFTFTPSITFSIAEFLDFTFSFSSSNNAFYDYYQSGNFFGELFMDLFRSFDFFGDGRNQTNFVMSEAKLDVVHYMSDWDLHCSYAAHIELNDDVYQFVPEFSIYLSWKILPDLKIDQEWQYNTTTETWER